MSDNSFNPWVSRFDGLFDVETIRRRATVHATPLQGLKDLPVEVAVKFLEDALEKVYVPTDQGCQILQLFLETALAHSVARYPSVDEFRKNAYEREVHLADIIPPGKSICLTGLSGEGKTALLAALKRVLPPKTEIPLNNRETHFPLHSVWSISIQKKSAETQLLTTLLAENGLEAIPGKGVPVLVRSALKHAYQCGVGLIAADEMQFLTKSTSASTKIVTLLMDLQLLGVPMIYACNYDLVSKLLRRPPQERRRLLAKILVLQSDRPDSHTWKAPIVEYRKISPETSLLEPDKHAELLYRFSAGIRGFLISLLGIAYRLSRKRNARGIEQCDIEKAYQSPDFAVQRGDIENLRQQAITNSKVKGHEDLWCPVPTSSSGMDAIKEDAETQRGELAAHERLISSLTPEERDAYQEILRRRSRTKPEANPSQKVVTLKPKSKISAAELRENAKAFREEFEKEK